MDSFLTILVRALFDKHPTDMQDICVVLPTIRACGAFRTALAKQTSRPVFAPKIKTISEFVGEEDERKLVLNQTLIVHLFEVYRKIFPETTFRIFYHWGQILLSDFDEIDRNLVNASQLYSNLSDLKQLDHFLDNEEVDDEAYRLFVAIFGNKKSSALRDTFLELWNRLFDIYTAFNVELNRQNICYEGSSYKSLHDKIKSGDYKSPYRMIYFAGFYALAKAEENIFDNLVSEGLATCYWDTDSYYADPTSIQEAGKYLKKNKLLQGSYKWKFEYFKNEKRKIRVTGVSRKSGQATYVGNYLNNLTKTDIDEIENTVLVLADETMLFPILNHLPEKIKKVNISMGYPFKVSMIMTWFNIVSRVNKCSSDNFIPGPLLQRFQDHPLSNYFTRKSPKDRHEYDQWRNSKDIERSFGDFENTVSKEFYEILRRDLMQAEDVYKFWTDVAMLGINIVKEEHEKILFEAFYHALKEMVEEAGSVSNFINAEDAQLLVKELGQSLTVPFDSGDGSGLQIMGFLETRLLDFKNVLITPVNEDSMPASSRFQTFIPFTLRKAYGLATFQDKDAVYAYHFYRLLQRASHTELIYNSSSGSMKNFDKSRYIHQIKYEMKDALGDNLVLEEEEISTGILPQNKAPITVPKTENVKRSIEEIFGLQGGNKPFSASSLFSYMQCSLQFYFNYIARIKEPYSDDETMDAPAFGNVVHSALHKLYNGRKKIDKKILKTMRAEIFKVVAEAFEEEHSYPVSQVRGKNLLTIKAIEAFVGKVLEIDLDEAPFEILSLEEKIETDITLGARQVKITGVIDRVDMIKGRMRISDFKTGKVDIRSTAKWDISSLRNHLNDNKIYFQLLFYALLKKEQSNASQFLLGCYPLKELQPEYQVLWRLEEGDKTSDAFRSVIEELVSEIFDASIPFTQTENHNICSFCAYSGICGR